jgi:hypothetical protein
MTLRILLALLASTLFSASASATIVVDSFFGPPFHSAQVHPRGPGQFSSALTPYAIGGERDLFVDNDSPDGFFLNLTARVGGQFGNFDVLGSILYNDLVTIGYDGAGGGIGGVDLTEAGTNNFIVVSNLLIIISPLNQLEFRFSFFDDDSMTTYELVGLASDGGYFRFLIPLVGGVGDPATLTDVDRILLTMRTVGAGNPGIGIMGMNRISIAPDADLPPPPPEPDPVPEPVSEAIWSLIGAALVTRYRTMGRKTTKTASSPSARPECSR